MNTTIQQQIKPEDVKVKILLTGGHQCTVTLKSDTPLFHSLIKTLVDRTQQTLSFSPLFQIPIDDGRSTLFFPGEHLVGLVTEPPIYLQELQPQQLATPVEIPVTEIPAPAPPVNDDLISRYAQIDNFLTPAEKNKLIKYVLAKESEFVSTSTSTNAEDYRRSMVLHSFPEFSELMVNRIKAILPDVLKSLNIPSFPLGEIEAQLTMHNDNNFYKLHNDSGSPDTASRFFTYVYYFYREPKGFSGGELQIYDSKIENNFYVADKTFRTVEPRNNSIVFFLSRYMHEVLRVSCPSKAFADSRFTINGWVRKAN
ncbi:MULTISPECIES: 2OG-Fe(II) oxygenase [unclassified Microcoleus]|uniref:2OG-Fe(II) oxygenase n=1 Tax=unclassified Microcoleus TaxID=2642155 RepID=UPI002FCF76D4